MALRCAHLQASLLFAIRGRPNTHQLNANASAQRLTNQPRPVAVQMGANPTGDVDRPPEVVLRSMHNALEVQQVATLYAAYRALAMPRPGGCHHENPLADHTRTLLAGRGIYARGRV
jgi:hypothetical protein